VSRSGRDPVAPEHDPEPGRDPDETRDPHDANTAKPWSPADALTRTRTPERTDRRTARERTSLHPADAALLATIGAFRIVPERELLCGTRERAHEPASDTADRTADLRSLTNRGFLESRTVVINEQPERLLALTDAGKRWLEAHRGTPTSDEARRQEFYAGLVKPRELAHDAQLYRLFVTERIGIEREGGRITRVVLDYELKREYARFLHEQKRQGVDGPAARHAFAEQHDLPVVRGHLELPDVRIEYEDALGQTQHRDLELATEHYSRAQLSGKHQAGFRVYRAARVRAAGGTTAGGTPIDPHHLEWLQ
jgi:hypothetical protein